MIHQPKAKLQKLINNIYIYIYRERERERNKMRRRSVKIKNIVISQTPNNPNHAI